MWFVFLGIGLGVVLVGGIYFRRRVLASLATLGVRHKPRRVAGVAIPWLLFGYPALVFLFVVVSLALGRESISTGLSGVFEWLLVYPFWLALLIMVQALPYLLLADLGALIARKKLGEARTARYRALACMAVVAAFAIYTPARVIADRSALNVEHYQVGSGQGARLRIVFLADLQQDRHTDQARADQVAELINDQNPDLILVGGDWINTGSEYIDAAAHTASKLRSRLGTTSVRGDHEHFAYRDQKRSVRAVSEALAQSNVEMIHNEVRTLDHDGKRIAIVYLSYNYIFRTPEPEIRELISRAKGADYSILVTHQFDSALARLVKDNIDLALIGHTHGGQVNPVVGFVHVPLARVESPYVVGRYQLGRTTLIVTSGIGYSIAPFRYAAPASIETIDLRL